MVAVLSEMGGPKSGEPRLHEGEPCLGFCDRANGWHFVQDSLDLTCLARLGMVKPFVTEPLIDALHTGYSPGEMIVNGMHNAFSDAWPAEIGRQLRLESTRCGSRHVAETSRFLGCIGTITRSPVFGVCRFAASVGVRNIGQLVGPPCAELSFNLHNVLADTAEVMQNLIQFMYFFCWHGLAPDSGTADFVPRQGPEPDFFKATGFGCVGEDCGKMW
jgi:hypothetical protein